MGYSSYSSMSRTSYASSIQDKQQSEIFHHSLHETMSPKDMTIRECRDSNTHPNTIPIIIGLDVTGSMGYIPEHIIKNSLTDIIENIILAGIPDPSILFLAIGDHISDNVPIQIGQFESGDSELAMWLERTYIEGRGGGNDKESYLLAWYVANNFIVTDHWEQRMQKGILITIGDERTHKELNHVDKIFGKGQSTDTKILLTDTKEKWEVFHIHANDGSYPITTASGKRVIDSWSKLLGQRALVTQDHKNIGKDIAKIVTDVVYNQQSTPPPTSINPKEDNSSVL